MQSNKSYKVVLVGNAGAGKTTFINRILTGEYNNSYVPTLGVDVHPLSFNTTVGPINFNVWDCAGNPLFGGSCGDYLAGADCAIIMCDALSKICFGTINLWFNTIRKSNTHIPIILAESKIDLITNDTYSEFLYDLDKMIHVAISSKNNRNISLPFLRLARILLKNDSINFIEKAAIYPPVLNLQPLQNKSDYDKSHTSLLIEVEKTKQILEKTKYIEQKTKYLEQKIKYLEQKTKAKKLYKE